MKFSKQEIMFLTSVSRGRKPLGVQIEMPSKDVIEEYIGQTMQQLVRKGILNNKKELTTEGAQILAIWELYRECKKHISLNEIAVAVLPEGKLIAVIPYENGYDVQVVVPELIMLQLLNESQYLCREETESIRGKWKELDTTVWLKKNSRHGVMSTGEGISGWKADKQQYLLLE